MHIEKVAFNDIPSLSYKDQFYQQNPSALNKFIQFMPDLDGLSQAIDVRKNQFPVDRNLLVNVLEKHYSGIDKTNIQKANIKLLNDKKTFTVVTAHQPSLLGGPAYYFYKIFSTINLCKTLKAQFNTYNFVPVFVSGAEDHDFEEIKSLVLYNKKVEWHIDAKGPVGRLLLTGLDDIIKQTHDILGHSESSEQLIHIFNEALNEATTYNEFVFRWLNFFFKDYGLIVLDMDDALLKTAFIPIIKKEILERSSIDFVHKTQDELAVYGFRPQAFAREINFFYMLDGLRERILLEGNLYHINHTDMVFSAAEMLELIESHPERFSPNVVTRPLYQEFILPNIAYVGGGGEIAYWLERKSQFEYFGVFYPTLIRRNSIMLLTKGIQKALDKPGINLKLLLKEENQMITEYLEFAADANFHLSSEMNKITHIFDEISQRVKIIDPTLGPFVLSEGHKTIKTIENIEVKLKKALKHKEEIAINQLKNLRQKLMPDNSLQERKDSLLPYMVDNRELVAKLIDICDPLNKEFLFLYL